MLADSNLYPQLQQFSHGPNGIAPFRLARLNAAQQAYNTAMSKVRIGVEWVLGDFKKKLKIGLSPIAKMYITCALLLNCHTCMYGSMTSNYFQIDPPTVQEYLA